MTADDSTPLIPSGMRGIKPHLLSHVENAEGIRTIIPVGGTLQNRLPFHHFEPGGAGVMTLCRWCGTPHHKKGNDPTKEMCK